jgi:hypothetical protein
MLDRHGLPIRLSNAPDLASDLAAFLLRRFLFGHMQ